jgi:hypothetical protein
MNTPSRFGCVAQFISVVAALAVALFPSDGFAQNPPFADEAIDPEVLRIAQKVEPPLETLQRLEFEDLGVYVDGAGGHGPDKYAYMRLYLPRSWAVRRIVEQAAKDRADVQRQVLPKLRLMLAESTHGYREKLDAKFKANLARSGNTSLIHNPVMAAPYTAAAHASVATYLLGEFDDYQSLPLLWEVYRDRRNGDYYSPVSRVLLFAVMDKLTRFHPAESLSMESRLLRKSYLAETKDLPRGYTDIRPTFRAELIKSDLSEVALTVYPTQLSRYEELGAVKPELTPYVAALEEFVKSAYPDYKPQLSPQK